MQVEEDIDREVTAAEMPKQHKIRFTLAARHKRDHDIGACSSKQGKILKCSTGKGHIHLVSLDRAHVQLPGMPAQITISVLLHNLNNHSAPLHV